MMLLFVLCTEFVSLLFFFNRNSIFSLLQTEFLTLIQIWLMLAFIRAQLMLLACVSWRHCTLANTGGLAAATVIGGRLM